MLGDHGASFERRVLLVFELYRCALSLGRRNRRHFCDGRSRCLLLGFFDLLAVIFSIFIFLGDLLHLVLAALFVGLFRRAITYLVGTVFDLLIVLVTAAQVLELPNVRIFILLIVEECVDLDRLAIVAELQLFVVSQGLVLHLDVLLLFGQSNNLLGLISVLLVVIVVVTEVVGVFAVADEVELLGSLDGLCLSIVLEHAGAQILLLEPRIKQLMVRVNAMMIDVVRERHKHIERNVPTERARHDQGEGTCKCLQRELGGIDEMLVVLDDFERVLIVIFNVLLLGLKHSSQVHVVDVVEFRLAPVMR